ncbi:PEP-CTERM sorting domain-containing protein [Aestuariibacter halophilus]|uniref:PEP-CTERM sorting domain-containing protein n=1 Tax=Fluctibacter halophilus TaxID=226011 RepID=A0ABS8G2U4_9ALTE|nr:PEP-CTERM sorting domain-containing protein [Aestuariibacter halophilus]MCC2614763.1 PEP-CTERM sorting domain-containing protein [Aestuariibacter halophilus]
MKLLKSLAQATVLLSALMATSFSANAVLITQDITIDLLSADAGNAFGVSMADSGSLFGTIQYESDNVSVGLVDSMLDSSFAFEITFGNLSLTQDDDAFAGLFAVTATLFDDLDPMSGINGFYTSFTDVFSQNVFDGIVNGDYVYISDLQGLAFEGFLSFSAPQSTAVSEPSMLALLLGGLVLVARRRRA